MAQARSTQRCAEPLPAVAQPFIESRLAGVKSRNIVFRRKLPRGAEVARLQRSQGALVSSKRLCFRLSFGGLSSIVVNRRKASWGSAK